MAMQKMKNGEVVDMSDEDEAAFVAARPEPLDTAKRRRRNQARAWLTIEGDKPVSALGIEWHGGMDSGLKLDAARRLAADAGLPGTVFTDTSNNEHALSFADATAVCLAVGQAYQSAFMQKQAWMRQIDAATKEAELPIIP